MKQHKLVAYFFLILAVLLWSSSFISMKVALDVLDPVSIVFARMAIASLFFLFFLKRIKAQKIYKEDLKYLFFMVLCEPCFYFLFEGEALKYTSSSQAGVIAAIVPILVAVFSYLFLKEKIYKATIVGLAFAVIGVIVLSLSATKSEHSPNPLLGNFLEFIAMLSAVGYTIVLKKMTVRYSALFLTAIQAFSGALFFFPLTLYYAPRGVLDVTFGYFLVIVYLGIFITVIAYGSYNFAISKIPANKASIFINLIPVLAVMNGYLFLNERLNSVQVAAIIAVIGGVVISSNIKLSQVKNISEKFNKITKAA